MVQRHYRGEADKDVFYRIPKMLFINPKYQNMALDAKVLYGLLLDRMGLSSTKEEWQDEDGSIYIIFRQKEAMKLLNVKGKEKIVKLYKELEQAELIERVKQGINRPDKIYVGKVEVYPAPNNQPTPPKPSYPHDKPDSDGHTPDNPEFGNRNPDEGGFVNRTPGVLES